MFLKANFTVVTNVVGLDDAEFQEPEFLTGHSSSKFYELLRSNVYKE